MMASTRAFSHGCLCSRNVEKHVVTLASQLQVRFPLLSVFYREFSAHLSVADQIESTSTESWDREEAGADYNAWKTLPAETAIRNFFSRIKAIAKLVNLLRTKTWGEELEMALSELPVTYDSQLVTQVLRADIPCKAALSFFQWLETVDGFQHSEYTYGAMLNSLGRAGYFKEMQELFNQMKSEAKVNSVSVSSVVLWLLKADDTTAVARIWKDLKQSGERKPAAAYTAYIDHLVRHGCYNKVISVFKRMLTEASVPGARVHTVFIQHLVNAGKVEAAVKILEMMQDMHMVPNRVTFEIVINGFAKANRVKMVLELLDEMREYFHRPTKQLMPAVMALKVAGKLDEATNLLREISPELSLGELHENALCCEDYGDDDMYGEDLPLSEWRAVTYSHVGFDILSFTHAFHSWNSAVAKALEQADVQWTSSLVLGILRFLKSTKVSWAFFYWLKDTAGFKHDRYSIALVMKKILKSSLPLEKQVFFVDKLFKSMKEDGLDVVVPMFNMVIRHYVAAREAKKALEMFVRIKDFHLEPNKFSYQYVIRGLAMNREGGKAVKMVNAMWKAGFELDKVTNARMMTCLGSAGKTEKAYALFRKISECGRTPSTQEYRVIMRNFYRIGDQNRAMKLYEEMREAGIVPNESMYGLLRLMLKKSKKYVDLNEIEARHKSLKYLKGKNKMLQDTLLEVLYLFIENIKEECVLTERGETVVSAEAG